MTPENFVYWLQGYMEIHSPATLGEDQVKIIRDHLNLVLEKKTPNRNTIPGILLNPQAPLNVIQC